MYSDKQLVKMMQHGSYSSKRGQKAADELFGRYYREIYAYIYKQCGDRELAMDLTQDTFVAAFRGLNGFDEKKSGFRTWLYHIAGNKVTDHFRSRRHHQSLLESSLDEMEIDIADEHDVLQTLVLKERVQEIMDIVAGYELEWIRIFQKKCFEDKPFPQISKELGISENTVKTRYYSMIKRIRKELLK